MRAGIGIVLSVLSFSVFAEVTSDYDYHGPLLVRRAVSPNNRAVLWKRSNDEQAGLGPSNSGAGTSTSNGGSNLDYSSDNRGPGKLDRFLGLLKRLYRFLKISWNTPKQKYIRWRDKRLIKAAVKKVAGIVDGENKKEFLSKIDEFLTTSLESVRMAFGLFDSKTKIPIFLLSIPEGKNQKSLTKEMVMIQTTGKKHTKEHLDEVLLAIAGIIKHPRRCGEINRGKVTLKGKKPSRFANFKSQVKSRLGIKSKPSTGVPPNNMPSKKDIDKVLKEMFG
ncbi:hypothetical protein BASA61_010052 [Batrachochytrium salamandrivorans]|nr:hypothetical protein BASA61_010052 [Batrachochytrium salamandrivorans]